MDPKNEKLPGILMKGLEEGGAAGQLPDVERLLSDYYQARQWDRSSGKPTTKKLLELGLDEVAAELH
jgi:aldehyde:ferredoxin oxidoreductase